MFSRVTDVTVEDLIKVFEANPATPFRLMMSCGGMAEVDSPRSTLIEGSMLYVAREGDPDVKKSPRLCIVSIPHITMIQKSHRPKMI